MVPWWSSYGNFDADESGLYPQARQVVAHFRCLAGWSREALAFRLGIGAKAMYYAEYQGRGLDSVSRLRALRTLLDIPPTLLGLCDVPGSAGWWQHEYEPWSGEDGWPDARLVVRSYRKQKGWTQGYLAQTLGIDLRAVQNMEQIGASLDSLSRRRALRYLLAIPSVLLGLDSVHGAASLLSVPALLSPTPALHPSLEELQVAQQRLWSGYYTGRHCLDELKKLPDLSQVKDVLASMPGKRRAAYLEQMSLLLQAQGNVSLAGARKPVVLFYMNAGIEYARAAGDTALLSTALGRRAAALYELGDLPSAQKSVKEALSLLSCSDQWKRYPVASRVLSCLALDRSDRSDVFRMIDRVVVNDQHNKGDDANVLLWCRAQVLLNLAEHSPDRALLLRQAADLLERCELTAPDTVRRHLIIKTEQARAYAGLREFEYAIACALEAFELMRQLKSVLYVPQLAEVYRAVSASFSSPQVSRLGLLLQAGSLH